MAEVRNDVTKTLQRFLKDHKDSYFIIGGHAAAYNLQLVGLSFRVTRDYDIVIVSEVTNQGFSDDLANLIESGGYRFGYKASPGKKIAYRFESPSEENYPEILEFFVREGAYVQSFDNRFAKLDIVVDEDKISAMVLSEDIYEFSKKHVIEINELMFVDKPCLIALKAFAYFENKRLHKEGKVDSEDYKKHARDILRIIGSFLPDELHTILDLPEILRDSLYQIGKVLTKSQEQIKRHGLTKAFVSETLKSLLGE